VLPDLPDHVVVAVSPCDEAALACDLLCHVSLLVRAGGWDDVGVSLAATRIQLCGKLVVAIDGERVEGRLPGRQGRVLLAFLALNRNRTLTRTDLVEALWAHGRDGGLAPLLSKLRRVVGLDGLRLVLPVGAQIDVEAAADAVHRAESAIAQDDPHRAWGPSQVALFVAGRPLLPGDEAAFLDEARRWLDDIHTRALEAYGQAGLGIGGSELASAVRAGRELARREPYRESGYRLLMEALAAQGNPAEALRVFEGLRVRLRSDLGVTPCAETQDLHLRLLRV
jgi:SARP family transcriptional regulator, regulator of embCAB operon